MLFEIIPHTLPLIAQACDAADNVPSVDRFVDAVSNAAAQLSTVRDGWDNMWDYIFTGTGALFTGGTGITSLYFFLSIVGQILAVGTLLFFMMQWFKDLNEGNFARPVSELLWPLLIAFLLSSSVSSLVLSNSINPLGSVIYGLRQEFINWETALYTAPGIVGPEAIETAFAKANAVVNTQGVIQGFVATCDGRDEAQQQADGSTVDQSCSCLRTEVQRSINLIEAYQRNYNGADVVWWNERLQELNDAKAFNPEQFKEAFAPTGLLAWTRAAPGRADHQNFLLALQVGFRQTLEVSLLFTAILGPIALGVSLLPVPVAQKSLITWFTGLAAVGSAKFFFYIVVGITSQVLLSLPAPPIDLSWFAIFMNTIAPLLAMGLASGGGAALFGGLNNFVIFTRG
jgi:hypothetical protein